MALVEPPTHLSSELEAALEAHQGITLVSRTSLVGRALTEAVKQAPDVVIIDASPLSDAVRAADAFTPPRGDEGHVAELTPREREVLALVALGRTSREIASLLRVAERTVETHREHIGKKLGTRTVAAFTRFAITHGILDLGEN